MSKLLSIIFAVLVSMVSVQAVAQTAMPALEDRVRIAYDRIGEGFRMGDLTRSEADRLRLEVEEIERIMRRARRDGIATKGERLEIRDRMALVERDIDRLIYNRRRR